MWTFSDLIKNFFTHKDFLPSADKIPGTIFTPLHFITSAILAVAIGLLVYFLRKQKEKNLKRIFTVLWAVFLVWEISKITWETVCGKVIAFEWTGNIPLYPCSLFLYIIPFAIWGKGRIRQAACGYVCTVGLIGGLINFVYPLNVLQNYSSLSFAGFNTLFYHGMLVFVALLMLASGYHSYKNVVGIWDLITPFIPILIFSIPAHIVNMIVNADYLFFRCTFGFLYPIGSKLPYGVATILVYIAYAIMCMGFYLPSFICNRKAKKSYAQSAPNQTTAEIASPESERTESETTENERTASEPPVQNS